MTERGPIEQGPIEIQITLRNYWYETISRAEALQRLTMRQLTPETATRIEKGIPEHTQHYLTFHGRAFREYAEFGDGVAKLLLQLPLEATEAKNTAVVPVPIHNSE